MNALRALVLVGGLSVVVAACGNNSDRADAENASRTIEVDMVDIAFEPTVLRVSRGETVRFVFTNRGDIAHDAFVGDADAQAEHAEEMREAGDEAHGGHDDDASEDGVTVDPGESKSVSYTFDEAGTVEVGCHQPGHYEAGMKIAVEVSGDA